MKKENRIVRLDLMEKFKAASPDEALGLNATVDVALDYVREAVENYVTLKFSDERIVEAIKRTTGQDVFTADDVRRARGRWERADRKLKKEAEEATKKTDMATAPKKSVVSESREVDPSTQQDGSETHIRIITKDEILDGRANEKGVFLREGVKVPIAGSIYKTEITGDTIYKAREVKEHEYGGMAGVGKKHGNAVYHDLA